MLTTMMAQSTSCEFSSQAASPTSLKLSSGATALARIPPLAIPPLRIASPLARFQLLRAGHGHTQSKESLVEPASCLASRVTKNESMYDAFASAFLIASNMSVFVANASMDMVRVDGLIENMQEVLRRISPVFPSFLPFYGPFRFFVCSRYTYVIPYSACTK
jgi:hypothetical protein